MKRIFLICSSITALFFVEIVNWICLGLDYLFYPGFKKIDIKPPLFIIGMPRSATTLCYDFLIADSETFSSMKLWEILLAPSIIQKKLAILIKKIDPIFDNTFHKAISRLDRFFFNKMEDIHPISIFNYEEDDYLLLHVFSTVSYSFMFPKNKRIISLKQFDESLPDWQKRIILRFYRNCIKRHLFVFGAAKRYLAKSPAHTPKLMTLLKYFPGSQFIYMLRNPVSTIASTLSLFSRINNIFFSGVNMDIIILQVLSFADIYYKYPLITCESLLGKSIFVMPFNDLTVNTSKAIQLIYFQLGQDLSDDYLNFLQQSEELTKKHITKNKYSLEEFGLTKQSIIERYNFIYQKYDSPVK